MSGNFELTVNGRKHSVDAAAETPLLYVLRNDLGQTDPKFGCGLAQCGACTVLVDGTAIRSCVLPISAAAGKKITSLAGLGTDEMPHPLQTAYIEEQVPQCGYCTSGWIMTAAALLERNPEPTDAEIRRALTGVKCRCGTHMAILRAVKRAAGLINT